MSADQAVLSISCSAIVHDYLKPLPREAEEEKVLEAAFVGSFDDNCTWMVGDDDLRFRCGIGALLIFYKDDGEMTDRIKHELLLIQALSAAMRGVPVDFAAMPEDGPGFVGMRKYYMAAKEKDGR